jgi:hypothetical protein
VTSSERHTWEKIRSNGRIHFIVFRGILRLGIVPGLIVAIFPYELGLATHMFSMSLWAVIIMAIFLSVFIGIGLGALIWRVNEKGYNLPNTDDHVPGMGTISKAEFLAIDRKMLRRQGLRKLFVLPLLVLVIAAFSIVPKSSPYRHYYIWGIIIVAWALLFFVIRHNIQGVKADCHEFGAECPKCGKPLYSGRGVQKGRCPNCGYQLFDDAVA